MVVQVKLRPEQEAAVDAIVKAFDEGKEAVVLDAPTGSGKSILHAELANRLGVRVFVTTPQISLVNQMLADPRFHALSPDAQIVIGRSNYACSRDDTIGADEATCFELNDDGSIRTDPDGNKIRCRQRIWAPLRDVEPTCNYYHHKMLAELSPVTVTSLAYFLTAVAEVESAAVDGNGNPVDPQPPTEPVPGWNHGRLSGRDVLMIDEAHGLAEATVSFLTTKFWRTRYDSGDWTMKFQEWLDRPAVVSLRNGTPWDTDVLRTELEQLQGIVSYQAALADADLSGDSSKDQRKLEQDLSKIAGALSDIDMGVPWIARCYEGERWVTFELQPVIAGRHLQRVLWTKARRFVLSSGTWIDPVAKLNDMGLTVPTKLVTMRSTFPAENGPTYFFPVTRFTHDTRSTALPAIAEQLWKMLRIETGRGVVHTQSYFNAKELRALAPADLVDRLILHGTDSIRNDLIRDFQNMAPPGSVLLSPSVTEGLDLPGDRGEFTAFIKCPFPNLGDERVRKRTQMKDGWRWYEQQAVEKTIQGRGRVIRSSTCVAGCYLYDEAQIALLKKWWAYLPVWFRESIQVGERRKEQQRLRIEGPTGPVLAS